MKYRKRWKEGYFRLPEAPSTLIKVSPDEVILDSEIAEAEVTSEGEIVIAMKSKETIDDFMGLSSELTREFREWQENDEQSGDAEDWVKEVKKWRLGDWQSGSTEHWNDFLGEPFNFTHFRMKGGMEGAIIDWKYGRSGTEVWLGDFHSWIGDQEYRLEDDPENFSNWNRYFDGGLLFALRELGLLSRTEDLHESVVRALPEMLAEERRAMERETGQTYLWPEAAR